VNRRPLSPCSHPGCTTLIRTPGPCDTHRRERQRRQDQRRGSAASRGYDARWRKARARHLTLHPLCVECETEGRVEAATVVDHIEPHRGDYELFWDEDNWQSLCAPHHNVKTATEDGGFGNG
jgi:5-methylcytosine-specific restriction protein A